MFDWIRRLFDSPDPMPRLVDPDFGEMSFFPSSRGSDVGIWQMHGTWLDTAGFAKVGCSGIPGTSDGPFPEARAFLLQKRRELPAIWGLCSVSLEQARARWPSFPRDSLLHECFLLTSLSMDQPMTTPPSWNVGFESTGKFWVYVDVRVLGAAVVGYSCDT